MSSSLFRDLLVVVSIFFLTLGVLFTLFMKYDLALSVTHTGVGFAILATIRD